MKKIGFVIACVLLLFRISQASAQSYGDLYDVEWCPCNPEERYDANGSVVLGKTVMCPCSAMYDGYGKTIEKDLRKIQHKAERAIETARNFKYYVGFDYNKTQTDTTNNKIKFDHLQFTNVDGLKVPANQMLDDQNNIGIVFGVRPNRNFGIEAFYNRSYDENVVTQVNSYQVFSPTHHTVNTFVTKYQAYGVDLLGYLPVTDYFDFIAFVGLGQYNFNNEATFEIYKLESGAGTPPVDRMTSDFSEDSLAWRVGVGMQVNIARGLVLRTMYRYIKLNTDTIKNLQEFSVGIRFLF